VGAWRYSASAANTHTGEQVITLWTVHNVGLTRAIGLAVLTTAAILRTSHAHSNLGKCRQLKSCQY
jgi:hypothetical protein